MRAFITGASGFVGRNLIAYLREKGDVIVALSRSIKSDAAIREAAGGGQYVHIVRGDVLDRTALVKGMKDADVVYHLAATVTFLGPWEDFYSVNVQGTRTVVEAAKVAGVPRMVHCSTEAVLLSGPGSLDGVDETTPISPPAFYAPYSKTKAMAEEIVRGANDPARGFTTVITRPRFIWGKGDTVLLPGIIAAVKAGKWTFFSPRTKTSTSHVRNVVEGFHLAATKGRNGETYFTTDGPPVDLEDFVKQLLETQGVRHSQWMRAPTWLLWRFATLLESLPLLGYIYNPATTFCRQMLGLLAYDCVIDDSKARKELGYKAHISREVGMAELREEAVKAAAAATAADENGK